MPYIPMQDRDRAELDPQNVGELNYAITCVVNGWLERNGLRYQTVAEVVGALECAKLEAYRRIAAPYEDGKRDAHGDVYVGVPYNSPV